MKIWIDADAFPNAIKDITIAAAVKRGIDIVFVANKLLSLPSSNKIVLVQVDNKPDAADLYIKENAKPEDLVITQDILLAHALVTAGISTINPHGKKYNEDNITHAVAQRNLMQDLRDIGEISGGPKQYGESEKRAFAAAFDSEISKLLKKKLP